MASMRAEEWRPVPDYEGLYEVSNEGRVRSMKRRGTSGKLLASARAKRGDYLTVSLLRNCEQTTRPVHSLVLEAFVGPRPPGAEIRHLDGCPTNARLTNLTYGTRSQNVLDKRAHGTDHNVAKTHCPQGHPYDEENTYVLPSRPNARYCKTCTRARGLARYHARKTQKNAAPTRMSGGGGGFGAGGRGRPRQGMSAQCDGGQQEPDGEQR